MVQDELEPYLLEFGEPAIVGSRSVVGIFDDDYAPALEGFAEGRNIVLTTKHDEVTGVRQGENVTIRNSNYVVIGVQPIQDGRFTDLILKEA